MGNVSQIVPTIHPYLAVATPGTALHTAGFASQSTGPAADAALRIAVHALAATVLDLIVEPTLVRQAHAAFERAASGT